MAISSINLRLRNSAPLQMEIADDDKGKTPTWKPWISLCSHRPWCNPWCERGCDGDQVLRLPLPVCHPAPPAEVLKKKKTKTRQPWSATRHWTTRTDRVSNDKKRETGACPPVVFCVSFWICSLLVLQAWRTSIGRKKKNSNNALIKRW